PGFGFGTSSSCNFSGPPNSFTRIAFIQGLRFARTRDLHGENRSKAGFALDDALISFRSFVELVSFRDDFYLASSDKVESFVEIFGPVLRAANPLNPLADQVS